jgi:hypothetical protein
MSDKLYSPTIADLGRDIPEHEHQHSLYVHCLECRLFGIPLPFKFNQVVLCGNCGSMDTIRYFPSCCIVADRKAVAPTWVIPSGKAL